MTDLQALIYYTLSTYCALMVPVLVWRIVQRTAQRADDI